MMNSRLSKLDIYPFWRLQTLLEAEPAPAGMEPMPMHVGEPKIPPPAFLSRTVDECKALWGSYPPHPGTPEFRAAAAGWLTWRYKLPAGMIDGERNVLPCAGTKEALVHTALVTVPGPDDWPGGKKPVALMPNPVYQVYTGAAVLAGAEAIAVSATAETGFMPDYAAVDRDTLARTAVLYLCNPGNPQGAVAEPDYLESLIRMAREYDFAVVFDECYSEIYRGDPPAGGLEICARMGGDLSNVLVLHSLSKRSSAPGIRVGTVAGDPALIDAYRTIRSYAGVAVPMPLLKAAEALLRDEAHVDRNRAHYADLFALAERILGNTPGFSNPPGGFYLWLDVGDGEEATRRLWREAAVRVMPGGYMAQRDPITGKNPGDPYIRVALVHDRNFAEDALTRIANVLNG